LADELERSNHLLALPATGLRELGCNAERSLLVQQRAHRPRKIFA
jgi:hypothetical protein